MEETAKTTAGLTRQRRILIALGLNLGLVAAQLVYGLASHSLGLLADAGHNLADVGAVTVSLVALRLTWRAPTPERSYGYHRGTILAALLNAGTILAVAVFIFFEGIHRLGHAQPVDGAVVAAVGLAAFIINAGAAIALGEHGRDLNMRSALLHLGGDAAASLGVAVAGLAILVEPSVRWLDPVVSMGIGLLIAFEAWRLLRQAVAVLLESSPADLDLVSLMRTITAVEGVDAVHDLHVWSLSSDLRALSAHLVLSGQPSLKQAQAVGERVKRVIASPFAVAHSTLELESDACAGDGSLRCPIAMHSAGTRQAATA